MIVALVVALCCAASSASAQLPESGTLSDQDWPLFRAEVARIEKQLTTASDHASVMYQLARTWASAKQWPETIQWLHKVADLRAGLDPSREPLFSALRSSQEFAEILETVRAATLPVSNSSMRFKVSESDLVPENLAYDPKTKSFFFGSMKKGKVLRCSATGACTEFAGDLGTVLGLKVHGDALWLLSNTDSEASLIRYDLAHATVIQKYSVGGTGHIINDLAIAKAGDIYLTDTRAAAVWHLSPGAAALTRLPGRFPAANGIALSPDNRLLYISTFGDGISVVDLKTQTTAPVGHPADLCLATIDGLYFHHGALIAIQNGFMSPRVARFTLTPGFRTIQRYEVLERRNPLFDGITTGVLVGNDFYYMANIQDDKKADFNPLIILKLHL